VRFPPVGVDQVLGLVKVIYHLGGRVDAMNINEAVDADLGDLAHVIDVTETPRHSKGRRRRPGAHRCWTRRRGEASEGAASKLHATPCPEPRWGFIYNTPILFFASTSVMQLCG
jgi:hypothetical protein